ncbi:hypothetical protein PHMEG_000381 [Phytophthora megakarya]|uniref:TNFR-Cys domain-containing protein n=1 Tax=Phytophthora megakarya TaxID=4795 RepID=A0A225X5E3_9STRA|nr:hypothetical protein PHMEG_000381 [Phytophthora megakarya]
MAASLFHVVVLLLFSDVQAQSSSSSSISIVEAPVKNTTNTTDLCSQDEYTNDCWYPVTCQTCLSRSGCAIEVATGQCVSSDSAGFESSSSDLSSAPYFLSGEVSYCKATDPACFTCRHSTAASVCLGSNCVCISQCENISPRPTKCLPAGIGGLTSTSVIAAAAVMCPLIIFMIFKGGRCSSCRARRLLRRREKQRRNLPGGLKLDAWRSHIFQREPVDAQFADLELRSCFVPMESGRTQQHQTQPRGEGNTGAETGESVHVEEAADCAVSGAVAATDLPSTSGSTVEGEEHATVELHVV